MSSPRFETIVSTLNFVNHLVQRKLEWRKRNSGSVGIYANRTRKEQQQQVLGSCDQPPEPIPASFESLPAILYKMSKNKRTRDFSARIVIIDDNPRVFADLIKHIAKTGNFSYRVGVLFRHVGHTTSFVVCKVYEDEADDFTTDDDEEHAGILDSINEFGNDNTFEEVAFEANEGKGLNHEEHTADTNQSNVSIKIYNTDSVALDQPLGDLRNLIKSLCYLLGVDQEIDLKEDESVEGDPPESPDFFLTFFVLAYKDPTNTIRNGYKRQTSEGICTLYALWDISMIFSMQLSQFDECTTCADEGQIVRTLHLLPPRLMVVTQSINSSVRGLKRYLNAYQHAAKENFIIGGETLSVEQLLEQLQEKGVMTKSGVVFNPLMDMFSRSVLKSTLFHSEADAGFKMFARNLTLQSTQAVPGLVSRFILTPLDDIQSDIFPLKAECHLRQAEEISHRGFMQAAIVVSVLLIILAVHRSYDSYSAKRSLQQKATIDSYSVRNRANQKKVNQDLKKFMPKFPRRNKQFVRHNFLRTRRCSK